MCIYSHFFFFFQAEDGIRDYKVTGVQTCALPISFLLGEAHGFAERLRGEAPAGLEELVSRAFLAAFSRSPDEEEAAASLRLIREHGVTVFCRAIFNASELLYMN